MNHRAFLTTTLAIHGLNVELLLPLATFVLPPTRASTIVSLEAPELRPGSLAPYDRDPVLAAVVAAPARR